jgi:hypothetical protein
MTTEENSVFKEFFVERTVDPFDLDTTEGFIKFVFEKSGVRSDPAIVQTVFEKTSGIPKWLVRRHVKGRRFKVTNETIQKIWEDMYS